MVLLAATVWAKTKQLGEVLKLIQYFKLFFVWDIGHVYYTWTMYPLMKPTSFFTNVSMFQDFRGIKVFKVFGCLSKTLQPFFCKQTFNQGMHSLRFQGLDS